MILNYKKAKENFLAAKINGCRKFFDIHGYKLEQAYCEIVFDNLKKAKELFENLKEQDARAHWGCVILGFIKGTVSEYPTYFELRNFLEIDLNILINYCKGNYVEKIVRYADFMFTINPEVHKFIGRVFIKNGLKAQAMFFLKRAKDNFYHDPELHYLLAEIYYEDNDVNEAVKALNTCLSVLPNYAPAKMLLKNIHAKMI